jgi:peptidoglycan/xylan/chitin deacetylase (PgdA/CDA1 family)
MRLAVSACALVIALFVGAFVYLVLEKSAVLASPPPASAPAPVVAAPHPTVSEVPVQAAAAPPPAETSSTVSQRTAPQEPPAVVAQAAPPPALASATPPKATPPATPAPACANPNGIGVARTVEIDTTGGPGFGFEHFREHDFLRAGEVVLTFDDGPWPGRTTAVLAALAEHCAKAIFFPIGKHATYEPGILKQVAAAGHSVGSHTWGHQNLEKKSAQEGIDEIEKGISAVAWAVGAPTAPFFRFPALRHPPELVKYLGERNVAIFSTDFDSFDFRMRRPEQVRKAVMDKLKKHGKGIVLMHDFQQATAGAAAELLNDLKAGGYKIVHMRARHPVATIASYDEEIRKSKRLPTVSNRPTSSVVRTVD